MRSLSRMVWNEGMHLAQHHFQAQTRYFEDSLTFALSHLFHKPYGLVGYEFDSETLRNGSVSLVHARGIMPDGLGFQFPDADPLPDSIDIASLFSPTEDSHLVHLVIPPYRVDQPNSSVEGAQATSGVRFVPSERVVMDDTTGQDEKTISMGRKNFRLALDFDVADDDVSLPMARIRRDGSGHFIYDPAYIPPCLQIGASSRLMEILRRILDVLEAKSNALSAERQAGHKPLEDYAASEVANFWLAHSIHSSIGPLRHLWETRRTSPEKVYTEISRLAGALCTFSMDFHPKDLPAYDHDNLSECFGRLDKQVRTSLDVVVPTGSSVIPLDRTRQFLFTGQIADKRHFASSEWIIGIRAEGDDASVVSMVVNLAKVCSSKHIVRLVKEGLPGLPLLHRPSPPSPISPKSGVRYFQVTQKGPCWESTVETGEIGVYVPEALPVSGIELIIVP
jgi:type VI secretion system protein ImpJ